MKDPPKSWKELTDPKYKDKLVQGHVKASGTSLLIDYWLVKLYGWDYFKGLQKNNIMTHQSCDQTNIVASGERPILMCDHQITVPAQGRSLPVETVFPEDGVNLTKFLPFAYMSCHAAIQSVYPELEHAANVLGASRARALRDITAPMIKAGLLGGWVLIFIPAVKELSSSILLFTAPTTVIATAIIDLYQLPSWEGVAALSTILLILNGVVIAAGNRALGGHLLGRPGGTA